MRQGLLEIWQLRYFVAVAEELHFGRAADRLQIAQPGLSQQIKALERALRVQLLIRDVRHVELTEAGRALLEEARLVISAAERAQDRMRLITGGKRGLLDVGTIAHGLHPAANATVRDFRDRFPEVEVRLHPGFGPESLAALSRRTVDVAFVSVPFEARPQPAYLRLGSVDLLVAVPEGHRLASLERIPQTEVLEEPFITWPRSLDPPLMDHINHLLFGAEGHPHLIETCDVSLSTRVSYMAREGAAAIAFGPEAELSVPGIVYRPLDDSRARIEYGLAWLDPLSSPLVKSFVGVAEEFGDGAPA